MKCIIVRCALIISIVGPLPIGCGRRNTDQHQTPSVAVALVKDAANREAAVLKYVHVEGTVSDTKQPQIAGVDVEMPGTPIPDSEFQKVNDLRGQPAFAEGILVCHIVVPEQITLSRDRGIGRYYELVDPATGRTAIARPLAAASRPVGSEENTRITLSPSDLADLIRDTHGSDKDRREVAISRLLPFLDPSMSRTDVERWLGNADSILSVADEVDSYYHCTLGVMTVEYQRGMFNSQRPAQAGMNESLRRRWPMSNASKSSPWKKPKKAAGVSKKEKAARPAPASAEPVQDRLYTLDVFLISGPIAAKFARKNRVISRTIEIRGDQTLEALHDAIFEAFDRFDEHMYEFQLGERPMEGPRYVAPMAMEPMGDDVDGPAGSVDETTIDSLNLKVGRCFGYWFDFGDDWWHQIDVQAIEPADPKGKYPKITKVVGKSPPQYGDEDDT